MELFLFSEIEIIQHLKSVMGDAINSVKDIATELNIAQGVFFIAGILIALTAAVFGYRLLKLVCAFGFGALGFKVGSAFFEFLLLQEGMAELPPTLTYVCGAVLAILFFFLGFKKFSYVWFSGVGMLTFDFIWGFTGDEMLAIGAAVLMAVLCVVLVRITVIVLTSFGGSLLAVTFIGQMLPDAPMLAMNGENDFALVLALGLGAVFALLQFLFARFYKAE